MRQRLRRSRHSGGGQSWQGRRRIRRRRRRRRRGRHGLRGGPHHGPSGPLYSKEESAEKTTRHDELVVPLECKFCVKRVRKQKVRLVFFFSSFFLPPFVARLSHYSLKILSFLLFALSAHSALSVSRTQLEIQNVRRPRDGTQARRVRRRRQGR